MKAIIYRVEKVSVLSANRPVTETGLGFAVLLGVERSDTEETARQMARRVGALPAYRDRHGKMTESAEFVRAEVTVIPDLQPFYACGESEPFEPANTEAINRCCQAFIQHFTNQRLRCGCVDASLPVTVRLEMDGAVSYYLDSKSMEVLK